MSVEKSSHVRSSLSFRAQNKNGKPLLPELVPYAGINFELVILNDGEPKRAAGAIWSLLTTAGWHFDPSTLKVVEIGSDIYIPDGVTISSYLAPLRYDTSIPETKEDVNDSDHCGDAAQALVVFLNDHDWEAGLFQEIPNASTGEGVPHNTVKIRIGFRPDTYFLPEPMKRAMERSHRATKEMYEDTQKLLKEEKQWEDFIKQSSPNSVPPR
jgi:hypothetical protein